MADRITMTICRVCKQELDHGENGWVDVYDGTPYCSLKDEEPHVPVLLVELPTLDALTDLMVASAAQGGKQVATSSRFRNSIRGWAKLALRVLNQEA